MESPSEEVYKNSYYSFQFPKQIWFFRSDMSFAMCDGCHKNDSAGYNMLHLKCIFYCLNCTTVNNMFYYKIWDSFLNKNE